MFLQKIVKARSELQFQSTALYFQQNIRRLGYKAEFVVYV
jgi:hypothetical protein